ncbi:helix-turn-helix domain-containing protein [Pisciglobus halotolerans]|uniref:Transcriptional activator, Rgg/GadR/MutR family, C-terminal domain-containing protein n=1 Tax=Pisciglobus halotolerans TaxID=745365 RepID=A0A1I3BLG2_9LACT|nr:Rgg/GadR/MutR family transcriptional regulator [Pisciglobus halotolerans]SFH63164.1 transcriptional activator, Rgg/GadR/MutR family, C-terminal domain-containing protein [Pisciglobus halotolerans]
MKRNYGKVLRKLREEKGYSLRQVSKGILSASFLSKFERGESDISLSHFLRIIDRLNITLDEFSFAANGYQLSELDQLRADITFAYQRNNQARLKNIQRKEYEKWETYELDTYLCNAIMAEAFLLNLQKKEIDKKKRQFVIQYLFNIEIWGNYELMLYANVLSVLPTDTVIALSKEVVKKTSVYSFIPADFVQTVQLLLNTVIVCLDADLLNEALYFVLTIEGMNLEERFFYERTVLTFLKGILKIKNEEVEQGKKEAEKAVQMMYSIGSNDIAINHEEYLAAVIEAKK